MYFKKYFLLLNNDKYFYYIIKQLKKEIECKITFINIILINYQLI